MRKVEVKINIRTSPEKVIAAFTNPDMLKEWWFVEKTLIEKNQVDFTHSHGMLQIKVSVMFRQVSSNHI
jgi:uncharacterized protein YndB with AHSA1/START domain